MFATPDLATLPDNSSLMLIRPHWTGLPLY